MDEERIVLKLESDSAIIDGSPVVRLLISEPTEASGMWPFECTESDAEFVALVDGVGVEPVASAGRRLLSAITANEGPAGVLTSAFGIPADLGSYHPIYIDLGGALPFQELPWEALCREDGGFLALQQWPVGRMLNSRASPVKVRKFQPPLKIAAVLSCLGVSAVEEWEALKTAVDNSPLPIDLLLLLSETALVTEINKLALPWVTVDLVPSDRLDLAAKITSHAPHILHFFCHGDTAGSPHLNVATSVDWLNRTGPSTHWLTARTIRGLVQPPAEPPWAIVLNACSSADTGHFSGAQSLAADLVREHGIQAVVGMIEPVLSGDAARFAGSFYTSLFRAVHSMFFAGDDAAPPGGNGERVLDWATLTVEPRTILSQEPPDEDFAAAARRKQWIRPALTVRRDPFRLEISAPVPATTRLEDEMTSAMAEVLSGIIPAGPGPQPPT